MNREEIIKSIEEMSVMELSQLIKDIEEKFDVKAQAPVAVAGVVSPGAAAEVSAEEKTDFDVVLKAPGDKKIQVIKIVREITGLGLKEAKELVDSAPKPVKTGIPKEQAEEIKKKLEEQGAEVEVK